jgi:hypothetical protein
LAIGGLGQEERRTGRVSSIPKKKLHIGGWLLGLAAAAVVVALVIRFQRSGFDWDRFAATFVRLNWPWFGASMLLALATYFGRVLRWEVMIRPLQPNASLWRLFVATAIGFTAVVIFGRPGELVRPYLIAVKEKIPVSSQIAAWILERIYDLLVVLLMFGFALTRLESSGAKVGPAVQSVLSTGGYLVGILCSTCLIILIGLRFFSDAMLRRILAATAFLPERPQAAVNKILTAFVSGMGSTRSGSFVALLILYTLVEWTIIVGCFYCLFQSFAATAQLGFTDILIFVGFTAFGSIVQIPGIGGGAQVASVLVLTQIFGIPLETASGIALLIWFVSWLVIVPFGLILAFHEGLNWKRLKEIEEEAASL